MILKILKVVTVISFLMITFSGEHIGGQYGLFLILGLFSDYITAILSFLILIILTIFLISAFKSFKKKDLYIFLIGGLFLMIPVIKHIHFIWTNMKNKGDTTFYVTLLIFLFFYGLTIVKIKREENRKKKI